MEDYKSFHSDDGEVIVFWDDRGFIISQAGSSEIEPEYLDFVINALQTVRQELDEQSRDDAIYNEAETTETKEEM